MPNDWELAYGFNPDSAADAAQDADGDGFTNLQEYQAGTDPRNPLFIRIVGTGPVALNFNATSNTTYSILRSPTVTGTWQRIFNVPAGPARPVNQAINPTNASGFFKLRAPALP